MKAAVKVTREDLQSLVEQPLGNAHLQAEAERKAHTQEKRSAELIEMGKRVSKKWLPLGKLAPNAGARKAAFKDRQIDLEDAIEAAGGKRGASGMEAATAGETGTGSTEGDSPTGEAGDAQTSVQTSLSHTPSRPTQ